MKFIDLFAGLGGFHIALTKLGHECVFASEIKLPLRNLYERNFDLKVHGDIRNVEVKDIPSHDILCAGFPCQPFSKAGNQKGLKDEINGNLFSEIVRILKFHRPSYFILENVQHLAKHDNEETYNYIASILKNELGYTIKGEVFSPHDFNIPQHRQRLFIIGCKNGLNHFQWPQKVPLEANVQNYLDANPLSSLNLEKEKSECLDIWQEFLERIPANDKLPSFPIWAMEFGATYPFEKSTPYSSVPQVLGKAKGNFGIPLAGMPQEQKFKSLPNYARVEQNTFPSWKKSYIRNNRKFFLKYEKELTPVVKKIAALPISSWQKFEWNIQGGERLIRNYIIQFRGSGIRLKKPDFFPSLVCVSTQIPIIGWQERYITKWEGARLQGMEGIRYLPDGNATAFDALGNAVNADIVFLIAQNLIEETDFQITQVSEHSILDFATV